MWNSVILNFEHENEEVTTMSLVVLYCFKLNKFVKL